MPRLAASDSHEIASRDEVFPHRPEVVWKTLTTPELIGRWFMMADRLRACERCKRPSTYQTTPAGEWDGVTPLSSAGRDAERERLVYAWERRA